MDAIYYLGHRVGVGRWAGQGGEAAPDRPRISRAAYLRSRHGAAGRSSAPEHFCPWALGAMGVGCYGRWVQLGAGCSGRRPQLRRAPNLHYRLFRGIRVCYQELMATGGPFLLGVGRWVVFPSVCASPRLVMSLFSPSYTPTLPYLASKQTSKQASRVSEGEADRLRTAASQRHDPHRSDAGTSHVGE